MRHRALHTTFLTAALLAAGAWPAQAKLALPRVSPAAIVGQTIATTRIEVTYCRPGVKDRVIWGGLVPYDQVWRTGANEATTFDTDHDVKVGGQPLAAGKYALFTIPGRDAWTVIFNSQSNQWGAFKYDSTKDVLRIQVKPEAAPHEEWMRFSFENMTNRSGDLVLRWEQLAVPIPIEADVASILDSVKVAMASVEKDDWRTPYNAASFCIEYDVDTDQGRAWAEQSTKVKENYFNVSLLARYMAAAGDMKKAIQLGEKAIDLGKSEPAGETKPTERLVEQWKAGN